MTSPPALLALDATLLLASATGDREVALADFFTGYRETVLRPGELIRAVRVPTPLAAHTTFRKIAKRRYDDISSVAVAAALDVVDGTVVRARIGLGGVAATPLRARATEAALEGRPWTQETVEAASRVLAGEGTPIDDQRASAAYRSAMLGNALRACGPSTRRGGARMSHLSERPDDAVVGLALPHESAALHVTGHALYTDDLVHRTPHVLHAHPVCSPHPHARVTRLDPPRPCRPGRRPGADRRRRARHQRRRREARRAAVPRRGHVRRPRRLLGAGRDPRGRPPRRGGGRGRLRAAPAIVSLTEAIDAEQLPGRPARRRPR